MSAARETSGSLCCSFPGCTLAWTNDYGKKLCSEHDRMRFTGGGAHQQRPIVETLRPASRPYQEPEERDELPF